MDRERPILPAIAQVKKGKQLRPERVAAGAFLAAVAGIWASASAEPPQAMLHLAGDAFVTGELRASDDSKRLRWQSPAFTRPFDFQLEAVKGVHFVAPAGPARPEGEYCFELAGGDVLFGSLVRLADGEAELEVPRLGRLRVRRDHIRSLYRWNLSELIYLGPNGLAGWKEPEGQSLWSEEVGQPLTDHPGASLFGDLAIPPRAVIELELSWSSNPDFTLAFGVPGKARTSNGPYRFEVLWRPQSATMLLPDARHSEPVEWEYTFRDPGEGWFAPAFQGGEWRVGQAGFGTEGTPGSIVRTEWSTDEIWLRRRFQLKSVPAGVALAFHHDEDIQVWINGQLVHTEKGFISTYKSVPLHRPHQILQEGENTLAVHCRQTGGGQFVDVGLIDQTQGMKGDLVAVCESDREADIASLSELSMGPGRVHLVACIDQERGQMQVQAPDGRALADLKAAPAKKSVFGGMELTNNKGDVRLERLRISRWSGVPQREVTAEKPRLHRVDGSIVYGELVTVDSDPKQFVLRDGDKEVRVPADQLSSVVLSQPIESSTRLLRAVYQDGAQVSGELIRVGGDHLQLRVPGILEPLRLPQAGLRSLVVLERAKLPASQQSAGPTGALEIEGLSLTGRLASGREQPDESCLVWQPNHSTSSSPLRPGARGEITFHPGAAAPPQAPPAQPGMGIVRRILRAFAEEPPVKAESGSRSLHFRNGDVIPCEVTRIDENGVTFKTPLSDATFVAHDRVKAVELVFGNGAPRLSKAKRERLLMLPRMQTPSPPTHLIRSTNGDFLRGNLISLDSKKLVVEVRSEPKEIRRDVASHVIWLHADELNPPLPSGAASAPALTVTRVHVQRSDGNRLTFQAGELAGNVLSGTSEVLGACRVDLAQVERILIGGAPEPTRLALPYHNWKLYRAIDPIYIQVLEEPKPKGPTPGIDSALVGKPAPDFEVDLLDGKKFRLANSRGRVVILDFWASWCGPCLQTMPQIDRLVQELNDPKVELVAVNLEEPASQITAMLERHKLQMTVALDRDGVVAAKYEVTAIPQTVVIDREGKIARLFVGGGAQLADQLRDAVRELLPLSP